VAGAAYRCALKDLRDYLTDAQMRDLVSASTVQEVHAVAAQALKVRQEKSSKSKILQVIQALDFYSKAMDILAQAHAEYTCLLWGTIKWFLQLPESNGAFCYDDYRYRILSTSFRTLSQSLEYDTYNWGDSGSLYYYPSLPSLNDQVFSPA
ncbi:MAG: hypothetical protein Q9214_006467, partial [Letrouitia sp. 1 TL-2023]